MTDVHSARVIKTFGQRFFIENDDGLIFEATMAGKLRNMVRLDKHPIAIGDRIRYLDLASRGDQFPQASIEERLERDNLIARAFVHGKKVQEIVLGANVDRIIVVMSVANPTFRCGFVDRVMVEAQSQQVPVMLLMNKWDLLADATAETQSQINHYHDIYSRLDVDVQPISVLTGLGMSELRVRISEGRSLLIGQSGVGKSSIVNSLAEREVNRTQMVSAWTGKGLHTTTNSEIIALDSGGSIIDTPGVKEFGLVHIDPLELGKYFPDFIGLIQACKFGNSCLHQSEPSCAIRSAAETGEIAKFRYESYLKILEMPY